MSSKIVALSILLLLSSGSAHYIDGRVKAFMVSQEDSAAIQVSQHYVNSSATCVFKFSTHPTPRKPVVTRFTPDPTDDSPIKQEDKLQSMSDIINRIGQSCAHVQLGYWDFEVCIGQSITQRHGQETYSLGKYSGINKLGQQTFEQGSICDAVEGHPSRSAVLEFVCDKVATQPHVVSISENRMHLCQYKVVVSTSQVCDSTHFAEVDRGASDVVDDPLGSNADGEEDWFMRISSISDGRIMCEVFSTQAQHANAKLNFHRFSLEMHHWAASEVPDVLARSRGRKPVQYDMLSRSPGMVQEGDSFNGDLSFVKIYSGSPFG